MALPLNKLAESGLGLPGVSRYPSPGQGLPLNEKGRLPVQVEAFEVLTADRDNPQDGEHWWRSDLNTLAVREGSTTHRLGEAAADYLIPIIPFMGAKANTNWSNAALDTAMIMNGRLLSTGAQNAEVTFDVTLTAGTWTFTLLHRQDSNRGIYTLSLDGTDVGTIDGYAAATAVNQFGTISGITVAATGRKDMRLKMATKNASSSSYFGDISLMAWRRTA